MTAFRLVLASILFLIISCKKEPIENNDNTADKGILYDTAHFGTKINIGVGNYSFVYWGRNSDEIFVSVGTQYDGGGSVQVDLLTKKSSPMDLAQGFVKGRNFDNSSMVILGSVNNVYGYYLYHFNTGKYSLLLKAMRLSVNSVNVSGSAVFFGGGDTLCPLNLNSCAGWSRGVYFHFIDADSKKIVPLPIKAFYSFSKTGKRTLLVGSSPDSIYIFDNDNATVVDSLRVDVGGPFYFDDENGVLKTITEASPGEFAIINAKTKGIIQKFRPLKGSYWRWSRDGTKLYGITGAGNSAIGVFDLVSNKETVFEMGRMIVDIALSLDNKKILYQTSYPSVWYIKNLQ